MIIIASSAMQLAEFKGIVRSNANLTSSSVGWRLPQSTDAYYYSVVNVSTTSVDQNTV